MKFERLRDLYHPPALVIPSEVEESLIVVLSHAISRTGYEIR
jgi:hypothetical protein